MENQANSKNVILNYGLYLGISTILLILIKYALGNLYVMEFYSTIISILLLVVLVVLGIKKYKLDNNELLDFGQGVKIGIGLTMIGTILIIIFYVILANVIEPEFMTNSIEVQKIMYADSLGMTEEQIEEFTKGAEDNYFLSMFGGILIFNLFLGGVTSLIAAKEMKKTDEETY